MELIAARQHDVYENDAFLDIPRTSLRPDREGPNRFDFIAEELEANRVVGIEREDVEDAATARIAGQFNGVDAFVALLDKPNADFIEIDRAADAQGVAARFQLAPARDRLHQAGRLSRASTSAGRQRASEQVSIAVGAYRRTTDVMGGQDSNA